MMWNPVKWWRARQDHKTEEIEATDEYAVNKKRLDNLLCYVSGIADCYNTSEEDNRPIYTLIRMLTDKMVLDGVWSLLTTNKNPTNPPLDCLFMKVDPEVNAQYQITEKVYQAFYENPLEAEVTIDMARDAVLVFPWCGERFLRSLKNIGTEDNPWREDAKNHCARLLLHMGVTHVWNGLHSTFAGMAKREGVLSIGPDTNHKTVDISALYSLLMFDGTNYVITGSDVIAGGGVEL